MIVLIIRFAHGFGTRIVRFAHDWNADKTDLLLQNADSNGFFLKTVTVAEN